HFDPGHHPRHDVDEHRVGERAGHTEPLTERADRPLDDLLGGPAIQLDGRPRGQLLQFISRIPQRRTHFFTTSPTNVTVNTRVQERHSQVPGRSSCGRRSSPAQYGQYSGDTRWSVTGVP